MSSRTKTASSNRSDSENPPTPESSSMEIEIVEATEVFEADGFLRDSQASSWIKSCHPRNAMILIVVLLALALSLKASEVFESMDVAIPSSPQQTADFINAIGDEDVIDLDAPEESNGDEDPDGSSSGGDSEDSNVVDLNAKNPKRDGVKFISPSCNYTCRTDRLPHESPLYPGQVLCNENMRFGMTESSELFIQDCQADVQTIFWSAKGNNLAEDQLPVHFEMKKNGNFEIISDPSGYVLFEAYPEYDDVTYHKMCLHNNPKLDCPYLHLHKDGVLVLNWIQEHPYQWKAQNVQHKYVGLNPED